MADQLLENLIADGCIRTRPYHSYKEPTIVEVNLDSLSLTLKTTLKAIYQHFEPLRNRYSGTSSNTDNCINEDIDDLVDFALLICYNRLLAISERYSSTIRSSGCNPRAPVSSTMEFPTWLSSLLSSIGPLRVSDGPVDMLVIYVPPPNTVNNYGRVTAPTPLEDRHARLVMNLRAAGVGVSCIDKNAPEGTFWTTCAVETEGDGLFSILGTVHSSHYTNDDILRAFVLSARHTVNPFQHIGMFVGCVDDDDTPEMLAKGAAPTNIPEGQTATSKGRGINPIYTCYLAQHITAYEANACLRSAFTRGGAAT